MNKSVKRAAAPQLPIYQTVDSIPEDDAEFHIVDVRELPTQIRQAGGSKYPVDQLKPGQSIVFKSKEGARNAMVAARAFAKRATTNGGEAPEFATRKEGENKHSVFRVK